MRNILALDIGGTFIKYALASEDGSLRGFGRVGVGSDYTNFIDGIKDIKNSFHEPVEGVAAALCGGYDFKNRKIFAPNLTLLNGRDVVSDIEAALKVPVVVENDANLAALGEYVACEKGNIDDMIFVTLGTGVGGGLIMGGKLPQLSVTGFEIGHICVCPEGRPCGCGREGCLDEYCSSGGLISAYKELHGEDKDITPEKLGLLAGQGDSKAIAAFEEYGKFLGRGLADAVNLFCPQKIKLGGGLSELAGYFLTECKKTFYDEVFPLYRDKVVIETASLKNNAGMVGAAAYFFMNVN